MKYYLIAGEASGDLHASHLMRSLKEQDPEASFRFFGGDMMKAVGGTQVRDYKELAYMQFIPVLLHLRTILRAMRQCKEDIIAWGPDRLILVDYPGFNLRIAKDIHQLTTIPIHYYISPKIWAWKEGRIKKIKRDVDELFSILPFEVPFFEGKHQYPIHYVGNPTVDEITAYKQEHPTDGTAFRKEYALDERPIIALLAGSRVNEIKDNLPDMIEAVDGMTDYQLILAGAPGINPDFYKQFTDQTRVKVLLDATYPLLQYSHAALVTSGTAALETALFDVPQVVCYSTMLPKLIGWLRTKLLKVKYISLPNLILDKECIPELVADTFSVENIQTHLAALLPEESSHRVAQLEAYRQMREDLGDPGAPDRAAAGIIKYGSRKSISK